MQEKQVTIVEFERDTISSEQGSDVLTQTTYKAHWGTAVNYLIFFHRVILLLLLWLFNMDVP
jgi:hypothetical protein